MWGQTWTLNPPSNLGSYIMNPPTSGPYPSPNTILIAIGYELLS